METRQLGAEATEKCGCFLSQQNLQLPPLLRYSVFNLLVSQFALLHLSKKRDEAFLLHCEAQALCWKGFSCVFQQETQFCVRGYTWLRSAVCVISLWLRSQLPHTFPGFFGEDPKCISNPPEATWLEDRHLPLHPDRFPTPHPVCQSYQMKTNGYIHPYPRPYHCPALQSGPSLLPELLHPVAAPSSSPLY